MNEKKLKQLQIISLAMILSVVIFIPIIYFIEKFARFNKLFMDFQTTIENYSFYVSAFLIILIIALRKFIYFPSNIVKRTEEEAFNRWYTLDIVMMSIGSTIGTIGFMAYLLGASYFKSILIIMISVLDIFTLFPYKIRYELRLKQLKEMKEDTGVGYFK
jgi:hypothetical protein